MGVMPRCPAGPRQAAHTIIKKRKHWRNTRSANRATIRGDDHRTDRSRRAVPAAAHRAGHHRRGDAYVTATPETLRWGRLPTAGHAADRHHRRRRPITFDTVSHEGLLGDQGADPVAVLRAVGHRAPTSCSTTSASSPAPPSPASRRRRAPRRARPDRGRRRPRRRRPVRRDRSTSPTGVDYGIVSNRHGRGVLAGEHAPRRRRGPGPTEPRGVGAGPGRRDGRGRIDPAAGRPLRLRPAAVPRAGRRHPRRRRPRARRRRPGDYGGNLDIRHLGVGSRLLLPVQAEGAGLYVGDPHFAQGNGEVALTAFEAPLRATLRVSVPPGAEARPLGAAARVAVGRDRHPHDRRRAWATRSTRPCGLRAPGRRPRRSTSPASTRPRRWRSCRPPPTSRSPRR